MKTILNSILICTILFICTACPEEEPSLDTVVWLDNHSDERIAIVWKGMTENYSDTVLINSGILKQPPPIDYKIIEPHSSSILDEFVASAVKANYSKPGKGHLNVVANVDSLEKYSWDKIVREQIGITVYFVDSYSVYERVNFRLTYPKR